MTESNFAKPMVPQESRLINIAVDTHDTAFTRILPHHDVTLVGQYRLLFQIQGNHQLVVVELAHQMPVVTTKYVSQTLP